MALKPEQALRAAARSQFDPPAKSEAYSPSDPASNSNPDAAAPATQDAAAPATENDVTIVVCSTCREPDGSDARPTPGEKLAEAVRAAQTGGDTATQGNINIVAIECLGNCKRRLSAALVTSNCWTYVFGDLSIENAADLIEGAKLMRDTTNGLMPWRGRPHCLKSGMVSRVPPIALNAAPAGSALLPLNASPPTPKAAK